jgi:hypothetical protein
MFSIKYPITWKEWPPPPASNHLFTVNEVNSIKMNDENATKFHHIVAQLLFLCMRAQPNIQTSVSFLCRRVKIPDKDDYKKLGMVIK